MIFTVKLLKQADNEYVYSCYEALHTTGINYIM